MSDPFDSSRRKIARAKELFADLIREVENFLRDRPYARVIEPDPEHSDRFIHKVRLTRDLPDSIGDITGDVLQNLRAALDNAGYAVAVAAGTSGADPKFTAFPFAGSIAQIANSLGRCKDVPQQIQSLFCGFQPYRGGDELLWSLNEMCTIHKHKRVAAIGTASVRTGASVGGIVYFEMPDPHVWDRTKNEMVLITIGSPQENFKYNFNFQLFVAFNEVQIVDGQPVLGVLHALCGKVEGILLAIEAECRRLGIFK